MADQFHAFIQNLVVATTGNPRVAAVISLPRSQVEMTEWDSEWQDKITKVVRRVAKALIANDETEISEVVRRRVFEDIGSDHVRKNVSKIYSDWCFDRRAQLPSEWTAVDSVSTEVKVKAKALKATPPPGTEPEPPPPGPEPKPEEPTGSEPEPRPEPPLEAESRTFRISGEVPPEIWNRLGTKVIPKLRSGSDLKIGISFFT